MIVVRAVEFLPALLFLSLLYHRLRHSLEESFRTAKKLLVFSKRKRLGQSLFHPCDASWDDAEADALGLPMPSGKMVRMNEHAHSVTPGELAKEERAQWHAIAKSVRKQFVGTLYSQELLDEVLATVRACRK